MAKLLALDDRAAAIEYRLIAAGIAVAMIAEANGLGTLLDASFTSVSTHLD